MSAVQTFTKRLSLRRDDAVALAAVFDPPQSSPRGEPLIMEGAPAGSLRVLCSGFAYSSRLLDGQQQILTIFLPGDAVDVGAFVRGRSSVTVLGSTQIHVAQAPRRRLMALLENRPQVALALWRRTIADALILEERLMGLGRRSAYARLGHFICEMIARMNVAVPPVNGSYHWPFTQAEIADVLGLSIVHANRMLQQLRSDGLIQMRHGAIKIVDMSRLVEISGFDPGYLDQAKVGA